MKLVRGVLSLAKLRPSNFLQRPGFWCQRRTSTWFPMSTESSPTFLKQKDDGSVEQILDEEELYRYTRYRWLKDESRNLAMRYRKFNMPALIDAAINAVGHDARACLQVLKCTEGQYNKTFIMTLDNGAEVVAKVPNPNAGPNFYTTASEVATRHFLRAVLNLQVPCIYAYSVDSSNPVGAEYIIEEKAQGEPLANLWNQWSMESQLKFMSQLVDFETKLTSISFPKHGCLYYKEHLRLKGAPIHELEPRCISPDGCPRQLGLNLMEQFAIGPLTEASLWEGERAGMDLDRGPWSSPTSYMAVLGINEMRWTEAYAKPRTNAYRSIESPESPDDYISLLKRYLQLVPWLSPGPFRTSLSHPDLHLDNIFVDPDTKELSCIIDWQSTSASEPFLQHLIPRMILPVDSRSVDPSLEATLWSPNEVHNQTEPASILSHYQNLFMAANTEHWAARNLHNRTLINKVISTLHDPWGRNDVFSFRHALIDIAAQWKRFTNGTTPCPIEFTREELELHGDELDLVEGLGIVLKQLQNDNLIPLGGIVRREDYERALLISNSMKQAFVDMAETDEQKVLYGRLWSYQDDESPAS